MNGIHDLGGMQGFGPVVTEPNEPPFHEPWEGRVLGMVRAVLYTRAWKIDLFRYHQEVLPARTYLDVSYYHRWLLSISRTAVEKGLVTDSEIQAGHAQGPGVPVERTLTADVLAATGVIRAPFGRPAPCEARFQPGDRVRTRNFHPTGHTRLPRYARDKVGTIERVHGCHAYPDAVVATGEEDPQWLYTVVFEAAALWGDNADPTLRVSIDAFEPYLEPA